MAKQVWALIASDDTQQLIVRQPNGDLRQVLMSNIRIDNTSLTNTDGQVKTYTIWADVAQTISRGTFEVVDWQDGAGNSIPDYQSATTYEIGETAVWTDWFVYRATTQTVGNDPKTGNTIHASWELINLGGINITHNPAADYATDDIILLEGKLYSPVTPITASWAAPVAFVEWYGTDEWYNIATGLFKYHLQTDSFINDEIVRIWNRLFQANNIIAANTPFVEGGGADEFRPVGSNRDFRYPNQVPDIVWTGWVGNNSTNWTHTFTPWTVWCEIEGVWAGWWRGRMGSSWDKSVAACWGWAYFKYRSTAPLPASISWAVWNARTANFSSNANWTGGMHWGHTSITVWWTTSTVRGGFWSWTFSSNAIRQWGVGWLTANVVNLPWFQLIESLHWDNWRNSKTVWNVSSTRSVWMTAWDGWDSKLWFGWTWAEPISITQVSVQTQGFWYGYWAAAYVKASNGGDYHQMEGWQGVIKITEYFS